MHHRPRSIWRLTRRAACLLVIAGLLSACVAETIACGYRIAEVSASSRTSGRLEFVSVEPDGSVVARWDGSEVSFLPGVDRGLIASDYANQTATLKLPSSTRWSSFLWWTWDVRDMSPVPGTNRASTAKSPSEGN